MPGESSSALARVSARLSHLGGSLLGTGGATRQDDDTTRGIELARLAGEEREQEDKKRKEKKKRQAEESKSVGCDDVEGGRGAPDGSSPAPRSSAKSSHSATNTPGQSVDSGAKEQPFYLKKRCLVPAGVVGAGLLLWLAYFLVCTFTRESEADPVWTEAAIGNLKETLPAWPPKLREVELPNDVKGSLFLRSMPGRGEKLQTFRDEMKEANVNAIACLNTDKELPAFSPAYAAAIKNDSLEPQVLRFPIPNYDVPANREAFFNFVQEIAARIKHGEKVMIQCLDGKGRTGMAAQSVLLALGVVDLAGAKEKVKHAGSRPNASDQRELVKWVDERIKTQATAPS